MLSYRPDRFKGQGYVISMLRELNYIDDWDGYCAGIAQMAIQAFLVDELDVFNARIVEIHWVRCRLRALRKKIIDREALRASSEYQDCMASLRAYDVPAFFEHTCLYQNPDKYVDLFDATLSQEEVVKIAEYASNDKMIKQGGLHKVDHFLAFNTRADLTQLFKLIQAHAGKQKIAMSFSCNNHETSVAYSGVTGQWILMDANQLPVHSVRREDLAERVFAAHSFDKETHETLPFSICFYALGDNKCHIERVLAGIKNTDTFRQIDSIRPEKLILLTKKNEHLLHLAANYNHIAKIDSLINQHHVNPNIRGRNNKTPLHYASAQNHLSVMTLLLESPGIAINLKNDDGESPLYLAVKNNCCEAARLLLSHGAKPYQVSNDMMSAVTLAAKKGHLSILKMFHERDVNLMIPDKANKTALAYALESGHQDVIKFLKAVYMPTLKLHNAPLSASQTSISQGVFFQACRKRKLPLDDMVSNIKRPRI